MASLDDRCRDQLIPEPVVFVEEAPGFVRFASDQLPWRALIDTRAGTIHGPYMHVEEAAGRLTLTDSAGRSAVYMRAGLTLNGAWICDLVRE